MRLMYTIKEGGIMKPLCVVPPVGEIFAIFLPDGTIWDTSIGVDDITKLKPGEFDKLFNELSPIE